MNPEVLGSESNMVVTFVASFLIWVMFAGLVIVWFVDGKIRKEQVLHAIMSALIAWVLTQMLKGIFPTLRPFEVNGFPPLTMTVPGDSAFPSGHTAAAFAVAVTMWLHDRRIGLIFIVVALAIGVGRVLGNVHYPLDILGGALIGTIVAVAVDKAHVYNLITGRKVRKSY